MIYSSAAPCSFPRLLCCSRRCISFACANIGSDRPRERQDLLDAALEEYVRATEELENALIHSISIIEDACDKLCFKILRRCPCVDVVHGIT